MKKTFLYYLLFLVYLEFVFHIACFKQLDILNLLFIFFCSLSAAVIFTGITSVFKHERVNSIIFKVITTFFVVIFCAELVYYKIYESFFNISGIAFIGAVKDGYDKVLLTIFQNIFFIILLILPLLLIYIKLPKKLSFWKMNESFALLCFLILGMSYTQFMIDYIDKDNEHSYYKLVYYVNMPLLNVKKMGFIASSVLSLERSFFGFEASALKNENILTNKRTSLASKTKLQYNETNIDFDQLIKEEKNEPVQKMHQYFASQNPTDKNNFTGMFQNKNVIFIVAESFDEIAIDPNLTPTLYQLKTKGIQFNNYFAPKYPASTADGEYMLEWSILPIIGEHYSLIDMVYNKNPYLLPNILKSNGYKTYVYHNYFGYYNLRKKYFSTLNFDGAKYCQEGISTKCDHFHGSDIDMMDQTVDDYLGQDPFYAYYITLSGHGSYDSSNFVANKHIAKLNNSNLPSQLKYYLAANIDFDIAMEHLISKLKEKNKLDDTVIIISSDHSPYYLTNNQVNMLSSIDRDNKFDRNRGSLIIYNSALTKKYETNKYAMNIDVLPTILNLLGLEYDSRLLIGKDIMSTNNDGIVIFPDRSWVNHNGSYDSATQQFTSYTSNIDQKYIEQINQEVNDKYQTSINMQYQDYYKYIFK